MIEAFGLSDVGRVRKGNEDSFACDQALRLFIVADGMGGHNAGEVASRLAVEAMVGFINRCRFDSRVRSDRFRSRFATAASARSLINLDRLVRRRERWRNVGWRVVNQHEWL